MGNKYPYLPASDVVAPKRRWALIAVLDDEGEEDTALAIGRWDRQVRLAIRWNGKRGNPIGNPQSRGLPTWFILPEKYYEVILSTLPKEKLTLARNFLPTPRSSDARP